MLQHQIEKLTKDIKKSEKDIQDRKDRKKEITSSKYVLLACGYNKLFNLTKDDQDFDSSIDAINLAIDLSPFDYQYTAKRADYYIEVDKYEKAKEDIDSIRDKTNLLSGIEKIYVENIVRKFDTKYKTL